MDDILRPYHHTAPVAGRQTTFCMLEYQKEHPPREIVIGEHRWVRVDTRTNLIEETIEKLTLGEITQTEAIKRIKSLGQE